MVRGRNGRTLIGNHRRGDHLSKKTKAELEVENRFLRNARFSYGLTAFFGTAVRWGCALAIVRYGYLSIEALAGQQTMANVGINVLGEMKVNQALAWVLAVCGGGYGAQQRKLRKDTVERLSERCRSLESKLDPKRTSSELSPRGDHPEDVP